MDFLGKRSRFLKVCVQKQNELFKKSHCSPVAEREKMNNIQGSLLSPGKV